MTKSRQLAVRVDGDLGDLVMELARRYNTSQANIVCAALHALGKSSAADQRATVVAYLTRAMPEAEADPKPAAPKRARKP